MLKTLAAKHRSTVSKMARKYQAVTETPHGPRRCYEARSERPGRKPLAARFGGIPLKRQERAVIDDRQPAPATTSRIITRLLNGECEWCGQRAPVQAHQVAKLADLGKPGPAQPAWAARMAKIRRKTLIVCAPCHQAIHDGKPAARTSTSLESRMHCKVHVRFGPEVAGKGPAPQAPRRRPTGVHCATAPEIAIKSSGGPGAGRGGVGARRERYSQQAMASG